MNRKETIQSLCRLKKFCDRRKVSDRNARLMTSGFLRVLIIRLKTSGRPSKPATVPTVGEILSDRMRKLINKR